MKPVLILLGMLALSGCAALPDDLATPEGQALLPFSQAGQTPATRQLALWGGEIASVSNLAGGSRLEVVQFDLNAGGRPIKSDSSGGRFRIEIDAFIDPAIYAPGRLVTARGAYTGVQAGKVGEHPYTFPVIHTDSVHLWPEPQEIREHCDCDPFFYTPFMMRPVILVPQKN